ncbi:MAG: hypothetical protein WEE36_07220 [Acidimicrobiia bacterium]
MRFRRALRDVGVGLIGFVLILALSYTVGRAFVPSFPQALGNLELEPTTTKGLTTGEVLHALYGRLAVDEPGGTAYIRASGVIEGEFALGIVDYREWTDTGVTEGPTLDLDMKYIAGSDNEDMTLAVFARELPLGDPRSEQLSVTFAGNRLLFVAKPGQCELELVDLGFTTLPPSFGSPSNAPDRIMPRFVGQVICEGLEEVRSKEPLSIVVVFNYDPEQFSF